MPAGPSFDALHLALASYHKCKFLVAWNCQRLANANKYGHIRRVNSLLGLYVPVLAAPLELSGEKPWARNLTHQSTSVKRKLPPFVRYVTGSRNNSGTTLIVW